MNERKWRKAVGIPAPRKHLPMQRGYWTGDGLCLLRENGRPIKWLRRGDWLYFANQPDSYEVIIQVWVQGHSYRFDAHRRDVTDKRPDPR